MLRLKPRTHHEHTHSGSSKVALKKYLMMAQSDGNFAGPEFHFWGKDANLETHVMTRRVNSPFDTIWVKIEILADWGEMGQTGGV